MILYLDTSAYVKQYFQEAGSIEVGEVIDKSFLVGTSLMTRAEMAAAFAKYARMGILPRTEAEQKYLQFQADCSQLFFVELTLDVVTLAGDLAWEHGLRGYDAVHLASALTWRRLMREPIILATFDRKLWLAASAVGLVPFPADLNPFLSS